MQPSDIATMVLGGLTLAWTIWSAIRFSLEKQYVDRVDGLLKIKSTLAELGTAGLDPAVDVDRREAAHQAQLETVAVALRRASATYVGLVHRAVPSYLAACLFLAYAVWAAVLTYGLLNPSPAGARTSGQDATDGIAALTFMGISVVLLVLAIVQWNRARRARVVLRVAGIDLRGFSEKAKASWQELRGRAVGQMLPADAGPARGVSKAAGEVGSDRGRPGLGAESDLYLTGEGGS